VVERLADPDVLQHRKGGGLLRVHVDEHEAHRLAAHDLQVGHGLDLVGLIGRHVHQEIGAAREKLGHLGLPVGDEADLNLADLSAGPSGTP
jgi:hypothetical protein